MSGASNSYIWLYVSFLGYNYIQESTFIILCLEALINNQVQIKLIIKPSMRAFEKEEEGAESKANRGGREWAVIPETSGLPCVNKAVQQGNKAGVWGWDIINRLAPVSGSVRAVEQERATWGTLGGGVGYFGCLSVTCQLVWSQLILFNNNKKKKHPQFLYFFRTPRSSALV